jgi:acetyl-CoA carboxylase carboxyltransferase component
MASTVQLIKAPMGGTVVEVLSAGSAVKAGQSVCVLEAMKMEHELRAPADGTVASVRVVAGDVVQEGDELLRLSAAAVVVAAAPVAVGFAQAATSPSDVRQDLARLQVRTALLQDAARPDAVARRHAQGGRTARENVADLCDLARPGNDDAHATNSGVVQYGRFIEYGGFALAAQTRRRSLEDLQANTPADGMVTGIGTVNAATFGDEAAQCVVMAYDYTVLAGTQGMRNHAKKDRMLRLAHQLKLPVVLFAEGGGGRPGDVDMPIVAGLNNHTFSQFAALSGKVPVVGVVHGRCFAGNAALLGCCDAIIATRSSNIGMGGPAMIEGGGLGVVKPQDIGPASVQAANGVIDVLVDDEAAAVAAAKQYLGYFQSARQSRAVGSHPDWRWQAADQAALRHAVPENRVRSYDVQQVIDTLFDSGSVLRLRTDFGVGITTALARIEGRSVGVLANNPFHLGGAIDADAADKAARFMQLCDAHGLPLISLMDTPGFMVGPEIEQRAQVRHVSRMFVVAAQLGVPFFTVVLRKGYGLGAQSMAAGGFDAPVFTVAWPTAEFGAMGLEGAVKLGFRKELDEAAAAQRGLGEAAAEAARETLFQKLLAQQYANGEALNMAATLEIDSVIDPADTRAWLVRGLEAAGVAKASHRFIDTW